MGASDILKMTGHALYGGRWQRSLSRDLGVSDRMIRYWAAGSHPPPPDLGQRLVALLRQREETLEEIIALIEQEEIGSSTAS